MSAAAGGVEFVCTGNICRSPFAAGLAVRLGLAPEQVGSSGLWAEPGRPCPAAAVATARELGVDLEGHRARPVDAAALAARDWVLVMEFGQLRQVGRLLPGGWGGRAELLGHYAPGAGVEVPDPYGGDLEEYRRAYRVIRAALQGWLAP